MNNNWNTCFDQFNDMSGLTRHILRRCAADRLICKGFDSIGSSDTNHELFAMWRESNQCWHTVMINEVDDLAMRLKPSKAEALQRYLKAC